MKYRIFDKNEKEYLQSYKAYAEQDGNIVCREDGKGTDYVNKYFRIERGIELFNEDGYSTLYEGDIVKCESLDISHNKFEGLIGTVSLVEGQFYLVFNDSVFPLWNEYLKYELVGNINLTDIKLSDFNKGEKIYEAFVQRMLKTPNDRFDITVNNTTNNKIIEWELKIDDVGIFRIIYVDKEDKTIKLWFTVNGSPKEYILEKEYIKKWNDKYKQYLKEKEKKFEEQADLKLRRYMLMKW